MKKIILFVAFALGMAHAGAQTPSRYTVGQKAPAIAFNTPDGKKLSLATVNKGAYVLIDFWASWCRPCRINAPKLVALYDELKDKKFKGASNGFRILSVSLDQNGDAWKKTIAEDNLHWPWHISDLGAWDSQSAIIYDIKYIPQAFLVDPKGKIIGVYNMVAQHDEMERDIRALVKD